MEITAMRIRDIAQLVRSKNVGPFQLTVDILFNSAEAFELAQSSPLLTERFFSQLYHVEADQVSIIWHRPALAFKATFPRPFASGSLQDGDIYGGQYHSPLVNLPLFPAEEGEGKA
jgi:hypothetical protein